MDMNIVCLDLEGVLVPEIWIAFAEASGIPELKRTTRDEPDYDKLMKWRLGILKEHGLGLKEIQETIAKIDPIPGAKEFLDELRSITQVIIISDTFSQFAGPLMKKLGYPTIFCNSLEVADNGEITGFKMRVENSKYTTVKALQSIGFQTIASGDSYNDLGMIKASKAGFLFRSTEQIKKDLAETSGLLSARRQELDNWMVAYQENSEGKTLEESLSEMTAQKSECSFRLRTHEENKRKIAGFQQELSERRAMSERWAKLNELAGSADGAKFRRIAQGYTLDVLLSYANVQLRQLSRRYRLERVPDTLALQVIDQDMCDEIRTVHSLSGGESFLVSLALALGLSSLSSNRMKVESLFIDEGFGSLDAETLRVAMDALESLRTQGRKIGVISHVQEMTERIPVQIRVNRAGNGRSYLEVI